MHDKNKDTNFDIIVRSCIQNPIKSLWWSLFAKKKVNFFCNKSPTIKRLCCLKKKKQKQINLYYFTYFQKILYDFVNCPAFADIKTNFEQKSKYNQRDICFLYIVPFVFFAFLRWIKFCICYFRQVFFSCGGQKSGRQSRQDRCSSCRSLCTSDLSIFQEDGKKIVPQKSRIAFCRLFIVRVKKVCCERKDQGQLLGSSFHYTLEWLLLQAFG